MRIVIYIIAVMMFSCAGPLENVDKVIPLSETLDVIPNKFEISPNSDTLLFGAQGTAIFIPADAFFIDSFEREKKITITLKEYYNMSDILMQNLSTQTSDGLLETGGMIHIKASVGDQKKSLKYGKELIVHFPKNGNAAEDMQLFSQGFYDAQAGSSNAVVWQVEEEARSYEREHIWKWYTKYSDLDDTILYMANGKNLWDWIIDTIHYSQNEMDYLRFRDINIHYIVTSEGTLKGIRYEKNYDTEKVGRLLEIVKAMPRLKPYTRKGIPSDNAGWLNFGVKSIPPKYATNKEYLRSLEKKYPRFEKQSINDLTSVELNYYIFNSAKLGWLNVDRFIDDPAPKVNMTLTLDNPEDLMVKLIYKDYKSVVPADFKNNVYHFDNIPENKRFTLMVIRNEPGKISMSITEHVTKSGSISGVTFKEYTMGDLKNELKKLD